MYPHHRGPRPHPEDLGQPSPRPKTRVAGPPFPGENVKLEALVVSHPLRYVRLKFGKGVYCVIELRTGDDAADVAKKLRELAEQVERLKQ